MTIFTKQGYEIKLDRPAGTAGYGIRLLFPHTWPVAILVRHSVGYCRHYLAGLGVAGLILSSTFSCQATDLSHALFQRSEITQLTASHHEDAANAICRTRDKGFIVAGYTRDSENRFYRICLTKLTSAGSLQWQKVLAGQFDEIPYSIRQTYDGGYVLTGETMTFGKAFGLPDAEAAKAHFNRDVYVVKTDSAGIVEWNKTYGESSRNGANEDVGKSVIETSDGGYLVTGFTANYEWNYYNDVLILKLDANGEKQWSNTFDAGGYDIGIAAIESRDGDYVVVGSGGDGQHIYLLKITQAGEMVWSKLFGNGWAYNGISVLQADDGGYMILGDKFGYTGNPSMVLIRTDRDGNRKWMKQYLVGRATAGGSFIATSDRGFLLIGSTKKDEFSPSKIVVIKTDRNGKMLWSKSVSSKTDAFGMEIIPNHTGGYIFFANVHQSSGKSFKLSYGHLSEKGKLTVR